MPKPPDERVVREVLGKNGRDVALRSSVQDAWDAFLKRHPEHAWWRRKATRAGLVWEYSVQNAIAAFETDAGVRAVPHDDTVSLIFDDKVLVRLKKADLQLRSRNYPTPLALLFHQHDADLFGFEGLQRVEAAYVLNRYETQVDWIGIVAREKRRSLWAFELDAVTAEVERLPLPEKIEQAAANVIRPKRGAEGKKQEDGRD